MMKRPHILTTILMLAALVAFAVLPHQVRKPASSSSESLIVRLFDAVFTDRMNVRKPWKECEFSEPGKLWNCMTNTMQAMDTATLSMIEKMSGRSPKRHHTTMTFVIHMNPHELRRLRRRIERLPGFKP
jgi:hypothetical protein